MVKNILICLILIGFIFGSSLVIYSTISGYGMYYVWGTMVSCVSILSYTLVVLVGIYDNLNRINRRLDSIIREFIQWSQEKRSDDFFD